MLNYLRRWLGGIKFDIYLNKILDTCYFISVVTEMNEISHIATHNLELRTLQCLCLNDMIFLSRVQFFKQS